MTVKQATGVSRDLRSMPFDRQIDQVWSDRLHSKRRAKQGCGGACYNSANRLAAETALVSTEAELIEDIIAQSHLLVDTLTFEQGTVALSALRAIEDGVNRAGPFAQLLGIQFQEMADGRCTASLEVKQHLLNPHGIAHGGVAFSLADSACGGAALSAYGGPGVVTQDMQIRYHGPARPGRIVARAEVIHFGKRTITTDCRVTQNGVLIASVTATFALLSEAELGVVRDNLVSPD